MSSLKLTQEELFAKSLVRLAIHKMGTARAASEWTGILESELSRFASDNTDRHIPFHLMMKLNAAADNAVIRNWGRKEGLDLTTAEQRAEMKECVSKLVGKAAQANAAFLMTALDASADGKITAHERRATESTKNDAIEAIETAHSAVTQLYLVQEAS